VSTLLRNDAGGSDGVDVDLSLARIPDNRPTFPAPDGQPTQRRQPGSVMVIRQAVREIPGFSIRLHDLRVSHGTWLLDQGGPVHIVAKGLGQTLASCSRPTLRGQRRATSQRPIQLAADKEPEHGANSDQGCQDVLFRISDKRLIDQSFAGLAQR
jgi:integrase